MSLHSTGTYKSTGCHNREESSSLSQIQCCVWTLRVKRETEVMSMCVHKRAFAHLSVGTHTHVRTPRSTEGNISLHGLFTSHTRSIPPEGWVSAQAHVAQGSGRIHRLCHVRQLLRDADQFPHLAGRSNALA